MAISLYLEIGVIKPKKGTKTGVFVPCEICGEIVYITQCRYNRTKHHFCSPECSSQYHHITGVEDRVCEFCGNVFVARCSTPQRFCSVQCQNEWQKTNVGELNARYSKVPHICDNCGTEFMVTRYKTKSGGHLFCSKACRQQWYANVWSQSAEWKENSRSRAVRILSSGKCTTVNSTPQLIMDGILSDLDLHFIREYRCASYSVDNYLDCCGLCVEVMGDYWHGIPLKYSKVEYAPQIKTIKRDIKKRKCIIDEYGSPPLYIWEYDLKHSKELCALLVKHYVECCGKIDNYHSFNYAVTDEHELIPNKDIITAYQDMQIEDFENMIASNA